VEKGDIVLVGATTENPSFRVNGALLSRCRVVVLEPLGPADLVALLQRTLSDKERGLGASGVILGDAAAEHIAQLASGDARNALNLLELAVADAVSAAGSTSTVEIDEASVRRIAQRKILLYDKAGEEHFNLISALHKSLRESHVNAAAYWLVRMLESGEDPHYVARRLLRFASEDVGLADPSAVGRAMDAWGAYERLGSPEGDLALLQLAIYLAAAPKSNAAYLAHKAIKAALAERPADPVPKEIRNAPTRLMREVGYGEGYVNAHDSEEGVGGLECLPEALRGTVFYQPGEQGFEARLRTRLTELDRQRKKARNKRGKGQ
jgi:putative ATPase